MAKSLGMRQVGFVDVAGGGQVVVHDGIAYVGHMRAPWKQQFQASSEKFYARFV